MATAVATAGGKTAKRDQSYAWSGMDKKGNKVSGKSLAPNESALRADLRRQGIAVSKIKKQSAAFKSGGKVKPEDIAVFSRQLATMLAAGIPLVQSFEIVGNGNEKPSMQKLVLDIKQGVEGGTSLHEDRVGVVGVVGSNARWRHLVFGGEIREVGQRLNVGILGRRTEDEITVLVEDAAAGLEHEAHVEMLGDVEVAGRENERGELVGCGKTRNDPDNECVSTA